MGVNREVGRACRTYIRVSSGAVKIQTLGLHFRSIELEFMSILGPVVGMFLRRFLGLRRDSVLGNPLSGKEK